MLVSPGHTLHSCVPTWSLPVTPGHTPGRTSGDMCDITSVLILVTLLITHTSGDMYDITSVLTLVTLLVSYMISLLFSL